MADSAEDFEEILAAQIEEQKAALEEVASALQEDADNSELLEMQQELVAAVDELETTLLEMKRSRLLQMLEQCPAAPSSSPHAAALPPVASTSATVLLPAGVTPGAACRFRYMDGRWYHGHLNSVADDGHALVHFLYPTRSFMLSGVQVPCSVLKAPEAPMTSLLAGAEVLALAKGAQLWEQASVEDCEVGGMVRVKMEATGQILRLPSDKVATQVDSTGPGSASGESSSEGGESGEESAGSSWDEDTAEPSGADYNEPRFGLGSVMDHAREAAEAGPQTETAHFAEWESHSRGIASKLLARMGYKHGEGLGSTRQGITTALEVTLLPTRRGLGGPKGTAATEGKKRKKRGGAKARMRKKMHAAQEAQEHMRQQQRSEEERGGAPGLFAFINNSLGDGSEAAYRLKTHHSRDDVRAATVTVGAAALNPALRSATSMHMSGEESRRQLMNQQDHVAALQGKVARLREMLQRNKSNQGLRVQIEDELKRAMNQLVAAQAEQSRVNKIISSNESQKKWLKF